MQIGRIRISYRCRLSLGGRFNLFRDCLSLNIAFDAFLHRVSIAGLTKISVFIVQDGYPFARVFLYLFHKMGAIYAAN